MITPVSLTIDEALFRQLHTHLFPGDGDEHGAVLTAGIAQSSRGTRLLACDLLLARNGKEYVPGTRGYRALTAQFVVEASDYCAREHLCYLAIHCHGGSNWVEFSADDLASHERGYPALLDITHGGPIGALVFAPNAVAGDIWTPQGHFALSHVTVVGSRVRRLYPSLCTRPRPVDPIYDRHARLFGDVGQEVLTGLKVGIIGLGGGGSLINEWLARLGVGHIVAVDFDRVDITNLPRIVGATRRDALTMLTRSRFPWLRKLGKRLARHKVTVARGVAAQANPHIRYEGVIGNILDEAVAHRLTDVDFLFLASDSMQSRVVFNALVHQYLIPGVQIGAKVWAPGGKINEIHVATRPILPSPAGGCLWCNQAISPTKLAEEALNEGERRAQRYIEGDAAGNDVEEPSVITLNALSAAQAANDLMMMFTGLYHEDVVLSHQLGFVRERTLSAIESQYTEQCLDCGVTNRSRRARGDRTRLPCRVP
ncbi:MAG: ThiF family adenylyltransferase [Ardenticatenaceae bacterium]|nr:ThiF family adenylyltransferase [Ardenticatenaceae bacterium]